MHKGLSSIIAAALLSALIIPGEAHTAIIDQGSETADSTAGLAWLDLTLTTNMSYIDVDTLLASDPFWSQYRRASTEELRQLFQNAGLVNFGGSWSEANVPAVTLLQSLLGVTYSLTSPCCGYDSYGFTSEVFGLGHALGAFVLDDQARFPSASTLLGYAWERSGSGRDDVGVAMIGHFLVREIARDPPSDGGGSDTPVPEPGTLALLGLGLAGLGFSRRRKTA